MFLSALQTYAVGIIIAIIIVQYAFALFCLLKLAYLDIDKKHYILWNLFILIVFFVGGIVFLVYYKKHPEMRIEKNGETVTDAKTTDNEKNAGAGDGVENDITVADSVENGDEKETEATVADTDGENAEENK